MYNNITGETPAPSRVGLVQLFNQYLKIASRDVHTQLPAKVLEIDYNKGFVTVQPLIKTMIELSSGEEVELLPVDEVPLMMISAKRGVSRLSTPVKEGDVGILYFSERDTGIYLNSDGTKLVNSGEYSGVGFNGKLNPIGFFPEIFTASAVRPIRSDATVLEDGLASIALKESGQITSKNPNCSVVQEPTGEIRLKNNIATLDIAPTGDYLFNNGLVTQSLSPTGLMTSTNTAATTTTTPDGSLTFQNNGCNITATSVGLVNVTAQAGVTVNTSGILNMTGVGGVSIVSGGASMTSTPAGDLTLVSPSIITLTVGRSTITITDGGINLSGPTQSTSIN